MSDAHPPANDPADPADSTAAAAAPRGTWRQLAPRLALVVVLAIVVAVFFLAGGQRYLSLETIRGQLDGWRAVVAAQPITAWLVYFALYVAVTALSLPAALALTLTAGALFGPIAGALLACLAATVGASLACLTSRYLLRDWVERTFGARLAPLHAGIARDGAYYLFTLRLVPAVPFFLINLGLGLTRMPLLTFAVVSFFGMLPATIVYVQAGSELSKIQNVRDIASPSLLISLALLGILPLALKKLLAYVNRRRKPEGSGVDVGKRVAEEGE